MSRFFEKLFILSIIIGVACIPGVMFDHNLDFWFEKDMLFIFDIIFGIVTFPVNVLGCFISLFC